MPRTLIDTSAQEGQDRVDVYLDGGHFLHEEIDTVLFSLSASEARDFAERLWRAAGCAGKAPLPLL